MHVELDAGRRAYYRETWGWDPCRARIPLDAGPGVPGGFRYEAGFPLDGPGDEWLDAAGVTIWARVDVIAGEPHNQVVFKVGTIAGEWRVECVHSVVHAAPLEALAELTPGDFETLARSPPRRTAVLPPEEHFVALRSFVAGLTELGLTRLAARQTGALGVNFHLRHQLRRVLEDVLYGLAGNPRCPPRVLEGLSGDASPGVRGEIAGNPATLPEVLWTLATDETRHVRAAVAENPACPPELLAYLVENVPEVPGLLGYFPQDVRAVVAMNPACPPAVLARLAGDADEIVRARVAGNPACPSTGRGA